MILRIASYILLFVILSSCGGGGGSSIENTYDSITQPSNIPFVYIPPSTTSTDNCVAKSQPVANSWHEDFSSNELNINYWSYDEGCNDNGGGCNGNNEAQNYTSNDSDNLFIEDGYLKIQPIYEQNTGSDGVNQQYTSAKIYTKDKKLFTYPAKISICFKVPEGTGMWPAIWMMPNADVPWPTEGEIDLMEARGRAALANVVGSAVHFGEVWPNNKYISQNVNSAVGNDYQTYFHSITFIWQEDKIDMYLDQESSPFFSVTPNSYLLNQYNYPFNSSFYMILNVAVGGHFDNYALDSSHFCIDADCTNFLDNPDKKRMTIDWIEYLPISN